MQKKKLFVVFRPCGAEATLPFDSVTRVDGVGFKIASPHSDSIKQEQWAREQMESLKKWPGSRPQVLEIEL